MMSMGSHFQQHTPPATHIAGPAAAQCNTFISFNTNWVAEAHTDMVEEDVEEGETDAVAVEVMEAMGNSNINLTPGVTGWNPALHPEERNGIMPRLPDQRWQQYGTYVAPPAVTPPPDFEAPAPWTQHQPTRKKAAKPKLCNKTNSF